MPAWVNEAVLALRRRVICNLPDTFLDWVSLLPLVKLRYQGFHVPSVLPFCFSGGLCVVLVSPLISRLEPFFRHLQDVLW